ncbi:CPBP family intramembrane glutamic endopeptidase [Clostridium ganghwense]|uniref:CPBP family intramembrane metalloprotease n=1 Tax=Clostridium ganghwense TaxID=312089 RepID=A0ABT4CL24_9CLOT|nr:CPBP family intramembrane glutamic endopeptidase [Clostridium ganghwense]MCY6369744.1 CPBP family intramembrane metalloprotease [Clostridium ganghwense]
MYDDMYSKKYILVSSLAAFIILYFVEQGMGVNYIVKTITKIALFTLIPYVYIKFIKKSNIKNLVNFNCLNKKSLKYGFLVGIISFLIILLAYNILASYIDLNSISSELQNKSKITPENFILIGAYITLGNSFLEEVFFRGFIFLNMYKLGYKKLAYIYSSVLFGIYHIAIFKTWFSLGITFLALFGLIAVGFVFNFLDTKSENFINSWVVHILADSAIIFIGFKMFKII